VFGGAVAGVAVVHALRAVGEEVEQRALAPRQHERIGAAWMLTVDEIQRRLDRGETPRDDGLFTREEGRSDAEEILEGLLLHAGDEYEERKLVYLTRLFAAVCFRTDVSSGYAHYLFRLAERLTYRQYGFIALFADSRYEEDRRQLQRRQTEARGIPVSGPQPGAIAELDQLGNESVLGLRQKNGSVAHFASVLNGGSFRSGYFSNVEPWPAGQDLVDLMGLADMPKEEIYRLLVELGADPARYEEMPPRDSEVPSHGD
jgi:hypothetical protein